MTNEEAIDYLVGIKKYYTEDKDFGYYGDEYHGLTVKEKEALCLAISVLNHSATDINVATKDGDMVYRQDAIDALDCINCTEEVLRNLPSAQTEPCQDFVKVVRCKKCRYVHCDKEFDNYWCNRMSGAFMVEAEGFCKWGR